MLPVGASVLGCTQSHWCECEVSSQRAATGRTVSRAADSDLRQASPDSYNGCATVGRGDASTCGYKRQPELPRHPLPRCRDASLRHRVTPPELYQSCELSSNDHAQHPAARVCWSVRGGSMMEMAASSALMRQTAWGRLGHHVA